MATFQVILLWSYQNLKIDVQEKSQIVLQYTYGFLGT